jgi:hypothetical protein
VVPSPEDERFAVELSRSAGAHLEGQDRRVDCSADMLEHHVAKLLARVRAAARREALEEAANTVDRMADSRDMHAFREKAVAYIRMLK